ncbi:MAG: lamin tail domain-containing protein, partial [Verrucomicrobiales bacterium]|nr:lamin tail domain-containing protein [Verrucomicrobiales bacterium]
EWFTGGQVALTDDFLELFNPLPLPVDISGLILTDNPNTQPALYPVPPLSFIGPGAPVAFTAGTHLNFGLSSTTETIALLDPAGTAIDAVVYISQSRDFSQRRDAAGTTDFFRLPTPGQSIPAPGSPAEAEYQRALALYDDLRITEVMYDPAQGTDFEFIEFQNTGTSSLDLSGLRVTTAVNFVFPPATTLAPGAYALIVRNQSAFESLYGDTLPVIGEYSGKLSNGGEEIIVLLPEPYEAAILRFSYDDAWHPITDGGGKSLVFTNPLLPVSLWASPDSWAPSTEDGGNPAGLSVVASGFPAWLVENNVTGADKDTDKDGIGHLLEYTLGLDPSASNTLELEVTIDTQGHPEFAFPLADPPRADITIIIETSENLDTPNWTAIATKVGQAAWSGTSTVTGNTIVTDTSTTFPTNPLHFYRIRAFLTP